MPNIDTAVAWAIATANDDTHGYSQANRYGPDYDCSSFVAAALIAGGFNVPANMYTGSEYNALTNAGFALVPLNAPREKGDIFFWHDSGNNGHTLMCINATQVVEARGDSDGLPGDGDGTEIWITNFYDYNWQYHFRWPGGSTERQAEWHNKTIGAYARESYEAQDNAIMIYNGLSIFGWSINAVCGLLGNIGKESGYNPWIWEGALSQDNRVASTDIAALTSNNHGYGLVGFTPSANYCLSQIAQSYFGFGPNFLDIPGAQNDGSAQIEFIHRTHATAYYPTTEYPETYEQFIASDSDAGYLAMVWMYNYERGGNNPDERAAEARYWQNVLPTLINRGRYRRLPIWMYLTRRRNR